MGECLYVVTIERANWVGGGGLARYGTGNNITKWLAAESNSCPIFRSNVQNLEVHQGNLKAAEMWRMVLGVGSWHQRFVWQCCSFFDTIFMFNHSLRQTIRRTRVWRLPLFLLWWHTKSSRNCASATSHCSARWIKTRATRFIDNDNRNISSRHRKH
jgi:hypothetical protein